MIRLDAITTAGHPLLLQLSPDGGRSAVTATQSVVGQRRVRDFEPH
jgi:hypothetical protein